MVVTPDGIAGFISGAASAGAGTGFSVGGTVTLRINTTGGAVDALIYDSENDCVMDFGTNNGFKLDLSTKCYPLHPGISPEAKKNRKILILTIRLDWIRWEISMNGIDISENLGVLVINCFYSKQPSSAESRLTDSESKPQRQEELCS